jgi:hypothetical protein
MKIEIFIIGIPGTGKTTIVRKLIAYLKIVAVDHKICAGWVPNQRFELCTSKVWRILGVFNDAPTTYAEGTDKMSMGVQPHFTAWIEHRGNLVIEGDRLANVKTLKVLKSNGYEIIVYALSTDAQTLALRYAKRGSQQNCKFIKGRITKIANLVRYCDANRITVHQVINKTSKDGYFILQKLIAFIDQPKGN